MLFSICLSCNHLLLWLQEARCLQGRGIIELIFGCEEKTFFDVLTGRITEKRACIRAVYIGDVWDDPGVWLWNTAGGLSVSCLSHLPRECQTIYLTRYSLSLSPWLPSVTHSLAYRDLETHTRWYTRGHKIIVQKQPEWEKRVRGLKWSRKWEDLHHFLFVGATGWHHYWALRHAKHFFILSDFATPVNRHP